MGTREGCRRRDSAIKSGPVWDTRMKPLKIKGGIKPSHDNLQESSSISSLSSIEDEKVMSNMIRSNQTIAGVNGKRKARKFETSKDLNIVCCDGMKKSPVQIKKAATLSPSSPSSFNEKHPVVKLRKVKSEGIRNNPDSPLCDVELKTSLSLQLVEAETAAATEDVISNSDGIESNSDLGKSPDGIERSGTNVASKELSLCQEMVSLGNVSDPVKTITSNNDDDEEEEEVNVIEEKNLVSANDARIHQNQTKTKPDHFHETPTSRTKLQNLTDLIMWRDASRSALVFGIGAFAAVSSSHTSDLNISFVSVVSYLGLVYLAAVFIFRSFITRENGDERKQEYAVVGEEEAIWVMKLVLPYLNEFLLNFRSLFSGDPFTTIKLAVVLFILARYGGSITLWKLAKLGFVGVFTLPKACSAYSTHLTSFGIFWTEKFCDAWKSCSHKKAIGFVMFSIVWNVCSVVARIWVLFVLFVAFKCYRQSFTKEFRDLQEKVADEK